MDIYVVTQGYDYTLICAFSTEGEAQSYVARNGVDYDYERVTLDPPQTFDKYALTPEEIEQRLEQARQEEAQEKEQAAIKETRRLEGLEKWREQERREGRMK